MAAVRVQDLIFAILLAHACNTVNSETSVPREDTGEAEPRTDPRARFVAPEIEGKLRLYDADTEADVVKKWHDLVRTPIKEATAMKQLLLESCDDDSDTPLSMCIAFLTAKMAKKCVDGLTKAECFTVTMYTSEGGGFYRDFNNASAHGVWAPYRVYTTLLLSALKKLAAKDPVPISAKLYRGMSVSCPPPNATRIFWKTFTSTSLDPEIASYFGDSTFLVFEDKATIYGAKVKNLSLIEMEEEVLIAPFEVFDFLKAEDKKFYFRASENQQLLSADSPEPHDGSSEPHGGTSEPHDGSSEPHGGSSDLHDDKSYRCDGSLVDRSSFVVLTTVITLCYAFLIQ